MGELAGLYTAANGWGAPFAYSELAGGRCNGQRTEHRKWEGAPLI